MPYKNIEISNAQSVVQQTQQQSQFYKGFSTVSTSSHGAKLYDFDIIKQDIVNHFNTRKGEKLMNPEFGSIIWDLLMEPLTEQVRDLLTQDIETICNYDPRVTPTQINLNEYDDGYILEITLLLKTTNESANLVLNFDQSVGLVVQ
jgi:phage baseplate assembly protein W